MKVTGNDPHKIENFAISKWKVKIVATGI